MEGLEAAPAPREPPLFVSKLPRVRWDRTAASILPEPVHLVTDRGPHRRPDPRYTTVNMTVLLERGSGSWLSPVWKGAIARRSGPVTGIRVTRPCGPTRSVAGRMERWSATGRSVRHSGLEVDTSRVRDRGESVWTHRALQLEDTVETPEVARRADDHGMALECLSCELTDADLHQLQSA